MPESDESVGAARARATAPPSDGAGPDPAAASASTDARHPESIGPYRILEVIGEGAMGTVYRVEQRAPIRRIVALKLVKLGMDTREVIARFEAERQALALMHHPNVAQVFDAGATATGRPYFVMEYVPGEPLTAFCDRSNCTTRERLELFIQACDAVQHAHQKAIIHRDLKPGNILVMLEDGKPVVKVIDFGVAKAIARNLTDHTVFTETGQLIGTPEYMSPEQAEMSALDIDTRTDIYSLGAILYELLTGALPFDSKMLRSASLPEIQRIIRDVDPPRPSTRLSTLGASGAMIAMKRRTGVSALSTQLKHDLEWIPLRAMRKDRSQRYATAAELAQDVRNYLEDRPLLAGPESTAYRVRKFMSRNRAMVGALTAVAMSLLIGLVAATVLAVQLKRGADSLRAERTRTLEAMHQADREAAKQAAVNQFLRQMLASADPRVAGGPDSVRGRDITVLAALNQAVQTLDDGSLADEPDVAAAVRTTIGQTFASIGEYQAAQKQFEAALAIKQRSRGANDPEVADCLYELGTLKSLMGNPAEAEALLRRALAAYESPGVDDPESKARVLNSLAGVVMEQGRYADAEPVFQQVLAVFRKAGDEGQNLVAALSNLGLVLQRLGRLDEAEPLYREAADVTRRVAGNDHPDLAITLNNLATLLRDRGKLDEAEKLAREALAIAQKQFGPEHVDVATCLNAVATILQHQKRYAEAEPLLREAVKIDRKALGSLHPALAVTLENYALVLMESGDPAAAEAAAREALAIGQAAVPGDLRAHCIRRIRLARVLAIQGKLDEAEKLLLECTASPAWAALPAGVRRNAEEGLISLYESTGRRDQAASWRTRFAASSQPATAPEHP